MPSSTLIPAVQALRESSTVIGLTVIAVGAMRLRLAARAAQCAAVPVP